MINGEPRLFVNGEWVPECAYVTYFDENNRYDDFAKAGYRLFSVIFSMASRPLNSKTGFCPYRKGIFDEEGTADFSIIDRAVERVLTACPNALIFPRIQITMPHWWCDRYPQETVTSEDGEQRELLYSTQFRKDGGEMLKGIIAHMQAAPYGEQIVGYQLAGGSTEEWFLFDKKGGYSPRGLEYFNSWLQKNGEAPAEALPSLEPLKTPGPIQDPTLRRFLEFANVETARSVAYFSRLAKTACKGERVVGSFYGYTLSSASGLLGNLAIEELLGLPELDFLCTPCSYISTRSLGIDWFDTYISDSIKLHGKLCFLECDIRTSLSKFINDYRPGADKNNSYYGDIWKGPKTIQGSVGAMRKAFAHQLSRGNSMWWFDMWGGWYAHPSYLREIKKCRSLYKKLLKTPAPDQTELAVYADPDLYQYITEATAARKSYRDQLSALGNCGVPYRVYLLSDFKATANRYKGAIFLCPVSSSAQKEAIAYCGKKGIPALVARMDHWRVTAEEIRSFAAANGLWVYNDSNDVLYFGNGLLALHAATAGEKRIRLPKQCRITDPYTRKPFQYTDQLVFSMKQFETRIFLVE